MFGMPSLGCGLTRYMDICDKRFSISVSQNTSQPLYSFSKLADPPVYIGKCLHHCTSQLRCCTSLGSPPPPVYIPTPPSTHTCTNRGRHAPRVGEVPQACSTKTHHHHTSHTVQCHWDIFPCLWSGVCNSILPWQQEGCLLVSDCVSYCLSYCLVTMSYSQ